MSVNFELHLEKNYHQQMKEFRMRRCLLQHELDERGADHMCMCVKQHTHCLLSTLE